MTGEQQAIAPAPFTARQAHDPATPPEVLARIAGDRPDLRALVAGNPATDEAVLRWLCTLGDIGVDAALTGRPALQGPPEPAGSADPGTLGRSASAWPDADEVTDWTDWSLVIPKPDRTPGAVVAGEEPPWRKNRGLPWSLGLVAVVAVLIGVFAVVPFVQGGAPARSKYESMTAKDGWQSAAGSGTSSTNRHGSADAPFAYGDDPRLDQLWGACDRGDPAACVDLYGSAPVDSEYEEFGWTCGGRTDVGLVESDICSEVM